MRAGKAQRMELEAVVFEPHGGVFYADGRPCELSLAPLLGGKGRNAATSLQMDGYDPLDRESTVRIRGRSA